MKISPAIFEDMEIRRIYDEKTETWFFSVVDIVQVLTQQTDNQSAESMGTSGKKDRIRLYDR